jgi:hypothetical protein
MRQVNPRLSCRMAADSSRDLSGKGWAMILRYVRCTVGPALWWTLLLTSAFVGIGGMSLLGSSDSDQDFRRFWQAAAVLAIVSFIVALAIFARRTSAGRPPS